jgi:hypothetical protein
LERIEKTLAALGNTKSLRTSGAEDSDEPRGDQTSHVTALFTSEFNKKKLETFFATKRQALAESLSANNQTYVRHVFL